MHNCNHQFRKKRCSLVGHVVQTIFFIKSFQFIYTEQRCLAEEKETRGDKTDVELKKPFETVQYI